MVPGNDFWNNLQVYFQWKEIKGSFDSKRSWISLWSMSKEALNINFSIYVSKKENILYILKVHLMTF